MFGSNAALDGKSIDFKVFQSSLVSLFYAQG